ncbi:hypothetical protein HMPREF3226_01341 [Prevotella corporis]|uniref:Uncharacterized protein n=1 Tax=Prevotella corporis TaxID=28128 RepID=A0A133Q9H0_9BACT|nr:hypothetical protein HMPREF3226_01341 [Prevotella corporis]
MTIIGTFVNAKIILKKQLCNTANGTDTKANRTLLSINHLSISQSDF